MGETTLPQTAFEPRERFLDRLARRAVRARLSRLEEGDDQGTPVCMGTLLSRLQYQSDLAGGLRDGRLVAGVMTPKEIAQWTKAAKRSGKR